MGEILGDGEAVIGLGSAMVQRGAGYEWDSAAQSYGLDRKGWSPAEERASSRSVGSSDQPNGRVP